MRKRVGFRIMCTALAAALLIGMLPLIASAESEVITGQFTYMPSFVDEPATDTYYYSDGYFAAPSTHQNEQLLTMSMVLSLASMEIGGDSYVTALLHDIGYADIQTDEMTVPPTKDTIGTAIAHKKIDGHDVIAVSIRGNKYGVEWASNLTAGASGNIEGFDTASKTVLNRVKAYISDHHLSNVKLWIAGYSRAGSVADLTGVYINEHLDEFDTAADDLFVYCFEAPRCCVSDTVYPNIYCVKNKNDLITYVYPASWGLYTNGKEIVIGSDMTVNKVKVDVVGYEKIVALGSVSMDTFNADLIDFISDELTREKFSGEFDSAISDLIELYFSESSDAWSTVFDSLKDSLSDIMSNPRARYILLEEVQYGIMLHNSDEMYRQIADELELLVKELVPADQLPISAEDYQAVLDSIYPLIRTLGPILVKDYHYKEGIDYSTALPDGYNDPTYDPQTAEEKILTYDQHVEAEQNQTDEPEEPEEPEEPMIDAAQGEEDGINDGYDKGKEDGLAGNEPLTEAPLPEDADSRSQEYLDAYRDAYMGGYENGYEDGFSEANPEHSDDYYSGENDADKQVAADAKKDALTQSYKASYNEEPAPSENGTPYSQDYLEGYHSRYREFYDDYYQTYTDYFKELNLYHFATLFVNREAILRQHYPQTNWALVKAMDSNYNKGIILGDADGDGTVSILDATYIQRRLANLSVPDTFNEKAACVDGGETLDITDATFIQRWLASIPVPYQIGESMT
ncbi:MAG: hypothetical protein IJH07_08690 [Ruminococcus sp.]|nr:hypothetical protein [Ruminococcus sp.]